MKVPEKFEVELHGDPDCGSFSVSWKDAEHRYHVWLGHDREPMMFRRSSPQIYVNPLSTEQERSHKTSYRNLFKHPKIKAAIKAIPAEVFEDAIKAAGKREEERVAKARADNLANLHEEAARVGYKLVPITPIVEVP